MTAFDRIADEALGYHDALHGLPRESTRPYYRRGYDRGLSEALRKLTSARTQGKSYKSVTYFATYADARAIANSLGLDRIIRYGRGWAIQYRVSGPYYCQS